MQKETQIKAVAGAASALVASLIPLITALLLGDDYTPGQFQEFSNALVTVSGTGVALIIGWAGVYFAPRNRPIENK